jgi:hypothetical protein
MASVKLTPDILSVCLLFSEGDISLSMEEIVQRAENFQEKSRKTFCSMSRGPVKDAELTGL